ncbi:hypothetical protein [Aestuariibius sp. HNIBRBA575]|uniref:hypothetical protein n=1 Tax=Aestuariibius sp. HNIBRBA575 TaxID=3233343 RepID=UPI0034A59773
MSKMLSNLPDNILLIASVGLCLAVGIVVIGGGYVRFVRSPKHGLKIQLGWNGLRGASGRDASKQGESDQSTPAE